MSWRIIRRIALFSGCVVIGVSTGGAGVAVAGTAFAVNGGVWGTLLGGITAGADRLLSELHDADKALRKKKRRRRG